MNRTTPRPYRTSHSHLWGLSLCSQSLVDYSPSPCPRVPDHPRPPDPAQSPPETPPRCHPVPLSCRPSVLSCDPSQTLPDCLHSPVTAQNALRAHHTPHQYLTLLHPTTPLRASHSPSQSPSLLSRPCPIVPETTTRVFLVILHKSQVLVLYRLHKHMKIIKNLLQYPCPCATLIVSSDDDHWTRVL